MSVPISLLSHQIEHVEKILGILMSKSLCYIDSSVMGTGKTYATGYIAQYTGSKLFVVCPPSANGTWNRLMYEHGISIVEMMSYQALRGMPNKQPSHGYLSRTETKDKVGKVTTTYSATDKLDMLISQKIIFVFDEAHSIKNVSDQSKAAIAIANRICELGGKCRYGFLSGSPFDKVEHSVQIVKFMGIVTYHSLYWKDPQTGAVVLKGLAQAINKAKSLDPDLTQEILSKFPSIDKNSAKKLIYELFIGVFKIYLSSEMPDPGYDLQVKELRYVLKGDECKKLSKAIDELANAARYVDGNVDMKNISWGGITLALAKIEDCKLPLLVHAAREKLNADPTCKVVLCIKFLDSIAKLSSELKEYSPMVIEGKVPAASRTKIADAFQLDPSKRLLIMSIQTGGLSISLHDIVGGSIRYMYTIPGYSIIDLYQAAYRIARTGQKSTAYAYLVYGTDVKHKLSEESILSAIARKKNVLKAVTSNDKRKLPGEYDTEYVEL